MDFDFKLSSSDEIKEKKYKKRKKSIKTNLNIWIIAIIIMDIISLMLLMISIFKKKFILYIAIFLVCIFSILLVIFIIIKIKKKSAFEYENSFEYERAEKNIEKERIKLQKDKEELEKDKKRFIKDKEEFEKEKEKFNGMNKNKENIYRQEKIKKLKKEIIERQKNYMIQNRNSNNIESSVSFSEEKESVNETKIKMDEEKEKNDKLNEILEDMCVFGNIMKEEIRIENEKNPEKFIKTEDALKEENSDAGLFALGLLSKNLQDIGIETCIENCQNQTNDKSSNLSNVFDNIKEEENNNMDEEEDDAVRTCLQFISNGLVNKKKYNLHFDFGPKRNEELLNDEKEYEDFKFKLKSKLSKDYNVPIDKIIVTFPQKGSFHVQIIFQNEEFNDLDDNEFLEKFKNDDEYEELKNLKEFHSEVILSACKLSKNHLDSEGNRIEGWGEGEKRGNMPYDPPIGWIGIGLKVVDIFEDNIWIGMNNAEGEWCVAYHGVGRDQSSNDVNNITKKICVGGFKKGPNQQHQECDDLNHPGNKVGSGVYCTPSINIAEGYAGESNINGKTYKTVLMLRVNPKAIRRCDCQKDYWVVDGTPKEIRPYRILYKVCEE